MVCIRDIVMSSVYRSEHAPRYYNEPHIRVLTWDRTSLLYLLQKKLQRLPPSLLMHRAATGPATIGDWLGGEDAAARARVLAAVFIGFLVERLIRGEPLAGREREVFIARATAALEALVPPQ